VGRERPREIEVNDDRKPRIQQAEKTHSEAGTAQARQEGTTASRPRAISEDGDDIQDRRSDDLPVSELAAGTGAVDSTQSQQDNAQAAAKSCASIAPTRAAQDPVAIEPGLAGPSVGPESAETSLGRLLDEAQDRKSDIAETARPSPTSMPKQPDPIDDSDSDDDDSWKAQAAIIEDIQKHYAEIDEHQASPMTTFHIPC